MKELFLVIGSLLTICAVFPYLVDIFKGKTKPNLVSWITWTLLTGIATVAELSSHEYTTAILTGAAGFATGLVVVMGLIRKSFVQYTAFDIVCQLFALTGIVLWQLFSLPLIAVIACVATDFIGALPTVVHAYKRPHEETWSTYALSSLGGLFGVLALTHFNDVSLPYPIYLVVINCVTAVIIVVSRRMRSN